MIITDDSVQMITVAPMPVNHKTHPVIMTPVRMIPVEMMPAIFTGCPSFVVWVCPQHAIG